MADARRHSWDTPADANAAHAAGWRIDQDLMYWRKRQPGDIVIPEGCAYFGLTTEDLPEDRVYVRSASYALAYDRGVVPPYRANLRALDSDPALVREAARVRSDQDEHYQGLKSWVQDYQACRSSGNVRLAKQIKSNIDRKIREQDLDRSRVYGADPDVEEASGPKP